MKNNYVKNHNFGYGNCIGDEDSIINKLELRNVADLKFYIKDIIETQLVNASVKYSKVIISDTETVKLFIELI